MKKIFVLVIIFNFLTLAQNKSMTLHYPDSSRTVNISNLDSISFFICGVNKVNYAGKSYNTVQIGNQCWLKENLNIGNTITRFQNPSNNGIIEKWCYYESQSNCATYGGLYSWHEAMQYVYTNGIQGICPSGWHIPTRNDFLVLKASVNNDGNALKREDQGTGGGVGTNTSGFSAMLAGYRSKFQDYGSLTLECFIWTSEAFNETYSHYLFLGYHFAEINIYNGHYKENGLSVRCIKD